MDLVERRVEDEKIKYIIGHCKHAAFRGAVLVKQMLSYSRQEVIAPRSVDLARLAGEISPLIKQAIRADFRFVEHDSPLGPRLRRARTMFWDHAKSGGLRPDPNELAR